jgi:hypothetical protein
MKTKASQPRPRPQPEEKGKPGQPVVKKAPPPKPVQAAEALTLSRAIKDLLVREPKMQIDELVARLEKVGFKDQSTVTIQTIRSDTLTTLQAARDAGLYQVEI